MINPRVVVCLIVAGALLLTWRAGITGLVLYVACVACALALAETDRNTDGE